MECRTAKNSWKRMIVSLLFIAPSMTPEQGQAAANLSLKGTLVVQACNLRPDDEMITLDLSRVHSQYLYAHTRTIGQSFYIHLQDCDTSVAESVTTTFGGRENSELPGLLALDGGSVARGIAIGIETPQNRPLPLNTASAEQTLSDGNNVIEFKAYVRGEPQAIADKSIRRGRFKATSTFTLAYP